MAKHDKETLAWLAEGFFYAEGYVASQIEWKRLLAQSGDAGLLALHSRIREGQGRPFARSDIASTTATTISYEDFSPPRVWQVPYGVVKATFKSDEQSYYMSHVGEELLIPITGDVKYHVFSSLGGSKPFRGVLKKNMVPGEIIRINPQVPHHTWTESGSATAWMILRDLSDEWLALGETSDRNIELVEEIERQDEPYRPTRVHTEAELSDPQFYALTAWGISDRIRIHRQRAGWSISELAKSVHIDAALLSRIENVSPKSKIPVSAIIALTQKLGIELNLWESPTWNGYRSNLFPKKKPNSPDKKLLIELDGIAPPSRHYLTAATIRLNKGQVADFPIDECGRVPEAFCSARNVIFASWFVLSGQAIFELEAMDGNGRTQGELVEEGGVLHTRQKVWPSQIVATQPSEVMGVFYSPLPRRNPDPSKKLIFGPAQ